jgi:hypothetical protein
MLNMDLISKSVSTFYDWIGRILRWVQIFSIWQNNVHNSFSILSHFIFIWKYQLRKKYTWQYKISLHYPLIIIMFYVISSQFNPLIYMTWSIVNFLLVDSIKLPIYFLISIKLSILHLHQTHINNIKWIYLL